MTQALDASRQCCWSRGVLQATTGEAKNFRYEVKPKARVSVFTPKGIPSGTDMMGMRPTLLGAVFSEKLTAAPKSSMGSILWEAARAFSSRDVRCACR